MNLTSCNGRPGQGLAIPRPLGWVAALGFGLCLAHLAFLPLGIGDSYWQVRAGEIILSQRRFLDQDIFSYTVAGSPWNNHEWLFEVMVALLHRALGWLGLRLLVLATIGGTFFCVARYVARRAGLWMALCLACAWLGLVFFKFIPAPQTTSMVLFLLGYWAFLRPNLWTTKRKLALLGFLLVWGNLTAEVVVFLPFLVVDQIFRALRAQNPDLPYQRRWLWLGLALVVPTLNPPGSSVAEYVLTGTRINRWVNSEFTHLWEGAATVHPSIKTFAWLLSATWVTWAVARIAARNRREPRLLLLHRSAAPALAIVAALLFERNLWILILPMVQMAIALHRYLAPRARPLLVQLGTAVAAFGFLALFQHSQPGWSPQLAASNFVHPLFYTRHLSPYDLPISCDGAVQALSPEQRLLTSRAWGNWMIWRFPERPVFIDGRNREYPRILHQYADIAFGGDPGAQEILDAFGVDAVLTRPGWLRKPGVRRADWQRTFATGICALYLRASPPAAAAPRALEPR
jgi:hypothetical protein